MQAASVWYACDIFISFPMALIVLPERQMRVASCGVATPNIAIYETGLVCDP
jgi:hypothetical protein